MGGLFPEYEVRKIASISGFIDAERLVYSQVPALKKLSFLLRGALKKGYGKFGTVDFVSMLEQTDKGVMLIHGEDDPVVTKKDNYDVLNARLSNRSNIRLMLVPKANHNPYWTLATQQYFPRIVRENKLNQLSYNNHAFVDYDKIVDEPVIMDAVDAFFKSEDSSTFPTK